ncbi:MAG: NTF2-like N-terminal transpeptidase domain-containing protein, partial [Egibacteraceae bacterium]
MDVSQAPGPVMRGSAPRRLWVSIMLFAVALGLVGWGVLQVTRLLDRGRQAARVAPPAENTVALDETAVARTAAAFLDAWAAEEWQRLQRLISDQSLDAASVHRQAHESLQITKAGFRTGQPQLDGDRATVPFQGTWWMADLGVHRFSTELTLRRMASPDSRRRGWSVAWWYPTVHPDLEPEARFERVRMFPDRAPILGRGGRRLVTTAQTVVVGFEPRRVTNRRRAARVVASVSDRTAARLRRRLGRSNLSPARFYPLAQVPRATYERHRQRLRRVDGLVFAERQAREVRVPGVAESIIGSTDEITAELLDELGQSYQAGDVVGQSGLERTYEQRLAGKPALEARIVDDLGLVRSLGYQEGEEPRPVRLTLDVRTQRAAQRALGSSGKPAALVAID